MNTLEAIEKRFSAKSFLDKSISWQNIEKILKAAIQAPNAGNLKSFRFILIAEDAIKEKLAEACFKQSWIAQAHFIIVICSSNSDLETQYHDAAAKYSSQDASAAAENLTLAATDLGIQSCWVSAFNEYELKMLLKIPDSAAPHIIIPLGYSTESKTQTRDVPFNRQSQSGSQPGWKAFKEVLSKVKRKIKEKEIKWNAYQ